MGASSVAPGSRAEHDVDGDRETAWSPASDDREPWIEIDLGRPTAFDRVVLQEQIREGQRVEAYRVEATTPSGWRTIADGTTIGHKKIDRFPTVTATAVRFTLARWRATPRVRAMGVYSAE